MLKLFILTLLISSYMFSGTIEGTVTYAGAFKPAKDLKGMDADPICGMAHSIPPKDENWILNENNQLQDVIVWIKNISYEGELDTTSVTIDQRGCMYSPHMNAITSKQKVIIKNSDATLHNINSQHPNDEYKFNQGTPEGEYIDKIFGITEEPFLIKCDVHGWMRSWVLVSDHPYYAITDSNGYYKIDNIPAGSYEIIYFQEKLLTGLPRSLNTPPNTSTVTVNEDAITTADFSFQRPTKK